MKMSIIGFSGSGKSTLAKTLSKHYNIPVMHMDSVHFLAGWKERDNEEFKQMVHDFVYNNESWIVEGNYKSIVPERHNEADLVIFLDYNRLFCYKSARKRYKKYAFTKYLAILGKGTEI